MARQDPDPSANRRQSSGFNRFDDWALGVSAVALVWICLYTFYYLLSDAWLGSEGQVTNLQIGFVLCLVYRTFFFLVDAARGQGSYFTRHPVMAFADMLALGALVMESWEFELGSSLLAPVCLAFLALVPILYRSIASRRLLVIFSLALAVEAMLLIVPQSTYKLGVRTQAWQGELESATARLKALESARASPVDEFAKLARPTGSLHALAMEFSEYSGTPIFLDHARSIDRVQSEVEKLCKSAEYEIERVHEDLEEATRRIDRHRSALQDAQGPLESLRVEVLALRAEGEEKSLKHLLLPALAAEVDRRYAYMELQLTASLWRVEQTILRLSIAYHSKLTDPRRVIVDQAGIWMVLVLGFLVQFQIRRFVTRRIETERSRTLSDMLSERHRMDAQNWINLTAGLTHNIGNEVRGYDVFLEEILQWLDEAGIQPPTSIKDKLDFIYRTNQARLGFVQFLREFALLKQVFEDERPVPRGLKSIPLEPAIRAAHARVQAIETSYNPPESTDPGDVRKRQKFFGTPLEVHHQGTDEPLILTRGREAVLDFFFYEMIKNALRHSSGKMSLVVNVQRSQLTRTMDIAFINDLAVAMQPAGRCDGCNVRSPQLATRSVDVKAALCENCLRARVENDLEGCFHPGRGSGTGLGLFVIKHFLEEYYYGLIHCGIESWDYPGGRFMVYFRLVLPDDLARAIADKNAVWSETN